VLNFTSGSAPFNVTFTDGLNTYTSSGKYNGDTIQVVPSANTIYSLTQLVDSFGCVRTAGFDSAAQVLLLPQINIPSVTSTNISCFGGSNGTITVNANARTSISTNANITLVFDVDKTGNSDKFNFKQKLGWLLGFRKTSYDIFNTNITAECSLDLYGPRYLYLAIDEFTKGNQNTFVTPLSSSLINKNIIARIGLDMQYYGYGTMLPANYSNGLLTTDTRSYTGKIDLQKLNVQLLNELGVPVMLNGHDFSFCLEASCE
jgi:hypothetical protein